MGSFDAVPPLPATPAPLLRRVFWGPHGLRAGWSTLLFLAVFIAFFGTLVAAARFLHVGGTTIFAFLNALPPEYRIGLYQSISSAVILLATLVMARLEGRSFLSYGLGGAKRWRRFAAGALVGFLALTLLLFCLWLLHAFSFGTVALHGPEVVRYGLVWAWTFLMVALTEETLTRGYLQFTLARGIGFWPAALLLSFVFGLGHLPNKGEAVTGLMAAGLVGLVLCLSLLRTGSLWWAVGFHAAWDWAESFFYGTPNSGFRAPGRLLNSHSAGPPLLSGGTVGPEGSVVIFPLLLALAFLVAWRYQHQRATLSS